jgi:hypothetical protein
MNIFHKVLQNYKELRDVCNLLIMFRYFVGMFVIFLFLFFILIFWIWIQRGWFCIFSSSLKLFARFHSLFSSSFQHPIFVHVSIYIFNYLRFYNITFALVVFWTFNVNSRMTPLNLKGNLELQYCEQFISFF